MNYRKCLNNFAANCKLLISLFFYDALWWIKILCFIRLAFSSFIALTRFSFHSRKLLLFFKWQHWICRKIRQFSRNSKKCRIPKVFLEKVLLMWLPSELLILSYASLFCTQTEWSQTLQGKESRSRKRK